MLIQTYGDATSPMNCVAEDNEFIYVVGQTSEGAGASSGYVGKFNKTDLSVVAQMYYAGAAADIFHGVAIDDDYVYVVGETTSEGNTKSALILQLHKTDLTINTRKYYSDGTNEIFNGVIVDGDSIFVCGTTDSEGAGSTDVLVMEFDNTLAIQARQVIGTANAETPAYMTDDSTSLFVVGSSNTLPLVLKILKADLSLTASKTFGAATGFLYGAVADSLYLYVVGTTNAEGTGYTSAILKLYKSDLTAFADGLQIYDSSGTDELNWIVADDDYLYAVGKSDKSGNNDAVLVQFNKSDMSINASQTIGTTDVDLLNAVVIDGNFIFVVGSSDGAGLIMRLSKDLDDTGTVSGWTVAATTGITLSSSAQSMVAISPAEAASALTLTTSALTLTVTVTAWTQVEIGDSADFIVITNPPTSVEARYGLGNGEIISAINPLEGRVVSAATVQKFHTVCEDEDYIYAAGESDDDALVMKFDKSDFTMSAEMIYDDTNGDTYAHGIAESGSFLYVAGYTSADCLWIMQLAKADLSIVKSRKFGNTLGAAQIIASDLVIDSTHAYVVGKTAEGAATAAGVVVKFLLADLSVVTKRYIEKGVNIDRIYGVCADTSNLYVVGSADTDKYATIATLAKADLTIAESRRFGDTGGGLDLCAFLGVDVDDSYVYAVGFMGNEQAEGGAADDFEALIVKFDKTDLTSLDAQKIYGDGTSHEYFQDVVVSGSHIFVVGWSISDGPGSPTAENCLVLKMEKDLTIDTEMILGTDEDDRLLRVVKSTYDGLFYAVGYSDKLLAGGNEDALVVKFGDGVFASGASGNWTAEAVDDLTLANSGETDAASGLSGSASADTDAAITLTASDPNLTISSLIRIGERGVVEWRPAASWAIRGVTGNDNFIYIGGVDTGGNPDNGVVMKLNKSDLSISVQAAYARVATTEDMYFDRMRLDSTHLYIAGTMELPSTSRKKAAAYKIDNDDLTIDDAAAIHRAGAYSYSFACCAAEDASYVYMCGEGSQAPGSLGWSLIVKYNKSDLSVVDDVQGLAVNNDINGMCEDEDNIYYVGPHGTTTASDGQFTVIRKSDMSLVLNREITGGIENMYDCCEDDDYVYVVGYCTEGASDQSGYLAKVDKSDWSVVDVYYTGGAGKATVFNSVVQDDDSIYVIGKSNDVGGAFYGVIIVKFAKSDLSVEAAQSMQTGGNDSTFDGGAYFDSGTGQLYFTCSMATTTMIVSMASGVNVTGTAGAITVAELTTHTAAASALTWSDPSEALYVISDIISAPNVTYSAALYTPGALVTLGTSPPITERGFKYGLSRADTFSDSEDGLFHSGEWSTVLTSLESGQTWFIRAYAVGGGNTVYGEWLTFTTPATNMVVTWDGIDVTSDIISARYERGKDEELEKATTGTCELRFRNEDYKYNPKNTGSVLYGSLLPGKIIAFKYAYQGTTYTLFRGRIERITPHPKKDEQDCYVYILDGMDYLAKAEISLPLSENVVSDLAMKMILDAAGWPALASGVVDDTQTNTLHDADGAFDAEMIGCDVYNSNQDTWAKVTALIDSGELTLDGDIFQTPGENYVVKSYKIDSQTEGIMPVLPWFQEKALTAAEEVSDCEFGFFYIDNYARAIFEGRYHRTMTARSQSAQYSFVEADIIDLLYDFSAARIYTEVRGTYAGWVQDPTVVDIAKHEDENPKIKPNSSREFWIEFDDIASVAYCQNGVDVQAHTAEEAGGTDVSAFLTINVIDEVDWAIATDDLFAKGARVVFTNGTSDDMYLSIPGDVEDGFKIQGDVFEEVQSVSVKSSDEAAENAYFRRTHTIDGKYFNSSEDLQAMCDYMVGRNKDPQPILVLEIKNKTEALMASMFDLRLSDRINLTCSQLNISDVDFFINKISHVIGEAGKFHTMRLTISQCEKDSGGAGGEQVWILGAAANCRLGTTYGEAVVGWP